MSHLPTIITDLAMILLVAGVTTILFKKIKNRFSNKSIGYNREYDKSILIRYLKMEE